MKSIIKCRKGMALVTVLLFTALLSILLVAITQATITHMRIAANQRDMEKALYVTEAAVERATAHIAAEGDVPATRTGTIGDGVYLFTILNGGRVAMGNCSVGGAININPNSSPNNEFYVKLTDGSQITRDDLTQDYGGYNGPATIVHVKPKGNGNQNGMLINGNEYIMENKSTYEILCPTMVVNIYNDNVNPQGKAVGHWWIAIAATGATVVEGL